MFRRLVIILLLVFFPSTIFALTLDEEKKYGRQVFVEISHSVRLFSDPFVSLHMALIKRRLESVADLPLPIRLTIIESPTLDAFATVGGYVFVTNGLLQQCDKEEEIAGVLSHEFGHVGKRHIAKRVEKEKFMNWGMMATMLAAMLAPGNAKMPVMVGGIGAGQALSLKYSREDEEEADRVGVGTAERAGYNGTGTADFLKKLKVAGLERNVPQYLLTHPYPDERIAKIEIVAKKEKTRVDVSLFPFLLARSSIISSPIGAQSEEIWMKRYKKDPTNALNVYGASLIVAAKGNTDSAITMLQAINSRYKRLFLGELLTKARRFDEAIAMLEGETHPIGRFLAAKAYEGKGDLASASRALREITEYGDAFPEIHQRLGMLYGRQGNQGGGYEYLGRYHLEMGREEAARINLEKAVSIYGMNSPEAENVLKLLDGMGGKKHQPARKAGFSFGPVQN